jgi:hypothetical protein
LEERKRDLNLKLAAEREEKHIDWFNQEVQRASGAELEDRRDHVVTRDGRLLTGDCHK